MLRLIQLNSAPQMLCGLNEATNLLGPSRCNESSQCEGARFCSQWGQCEGNSGCEVTPTLTGHANFGDITTEGALDYNGTGAGLNVQRLNLGVSPSINVSLQNLGLTKFADCAACDLLTSFQ